MTRPERRQQAALSAAFNGAIDLSALKNKPGPTGAPGGGPQNPPSKYSVEVTEEAFGEVVQASTDVLVVFDLWSARSTLSASVSSALNAVVEEGHGSWLLARVDVDANPRVAQAFQATQIPTIIAVAGGQPVDAYPGAADEASVRGWITGLLDALRDRLPGIRAAEEAAGVQSAPAAEPEDPRFVAAEDALMAGDYDTAKTELEEILTAEPGNERAAAALAQTVFLARTEALPADTVARADAAPEDIALQCDAADLLVAGGEVEAAFDRLVATVKRTAGDDRTTAREHLVELFGLFASDDELVKQARRKLAAALY